MKKYRPQKAINSKLTYAISIHQQGKLDDAEKIYKSVLKNEPSNPDALHFFGILLHQMGHSSKAIECINRALRVNPQYLDAYLNLGNIFKESGDLTSAITVYRKLITLAPHFAQAYNNLGVVLRNNGDLIESIDELKKALDLAPDTADFFHNLGNSYRDNNEVQQAVAAYQRSIDLKPDKNDAYKSLWRMLQEKGHKEAAGEVLQKWLETDPANPVARHYYSACIGNGIPDRASDAYIRETFDQFASTFDEVLSKLDYKAPELVLQAVLRVFPQANGELSILDAGCGTGLCGPLLKPYAKRMIGVDLSSAMINKAKGRQVYNELIEADLVSYLRQQHQIRFDLIISADTLCYFGDLKPFFQAASNCLKAGGFLIFTLEKIDYAGYKDYQLNHHGRFSHDKDYVGQALDSCDFNWVNSETVVLRQESGGQVIGLLVTARMKEVSAYSH